MTRREQVLVKTVDVATRNVMTGALKCLRQWSNDPAIRHQVRQLLQYCREARAAVRDGQWHDATKCGHRASAVAKGIQAIAESYQLSLDYIPPGLREIAGLAKA